MLIDLSIDPQKTVEEITNFIKNTIHSAGFSKLVVALSGGLDSATSTTLAVAAQGADNIHFALYPYGKLYEEGLKDAHLLLKRLSIASSNLHEVDIKPLVDPIIALDSSADKLRKGNIMVRMRMILLYDLAKKYNALVLGTENKTEHLLGYFTRFGDEASDIEPIRSLYKTQVRQLATYLKIPNEIIDKAPTAGMWLGQTDEGEFGFTYEQADQVLHLYIDQKMSREEIKKEGFDPRAIEKVIARLETNKFKHKLPYILLG